MAAGSVIAIWAAHGLAWVAGIGLSIVPVYQGASTRATAPGEPPAETIMHSATLIEANGAHAILLLLIPVLLTGVAVLALYVTRPQRPIRRFLLWIPGAILLGFCAVGILSIGALYLPAAIVLLCGAGLQSTGGDRARTD